MTAPAPQSSIEIARGIVDGWHDDTFGALDLETRIADALDAARASERERCAKVAGHIAAEYRARASERHSKAFHGTADDLNSVAAGAAEAAAAIRALIPSTALIDEGGPTT